MAASDEELVASVVATGDHRAFGELMRRHQSSVRGWLQYLTHDASLTDELAQVTFIRAWRRIASFSGSGSFRGWLMRMAYRVLVDEQRSRRRALRLGEALQHDPLRADEVGHDGETPDAAKMMAILSGDERRVMVLCHAFGCSHGEASELLDMPLGTVKSHLRRAKERIRARFGIEG